MVSKNNKNQKLKIYKKTVADRLEKLIPIFQKIAAGDFSGKIEVPSKEDEFTPLVAALSMVLDDLNFLGKENKQKTNDLEMAKTNLENKVEERTKELKELADSLEQKVKARTAELQEKIDEMEKFQKIAIGRELRMIELKKELTEMKKGNNPAS